MPIVGLQVATEQTVVGLFPCVSYMWAAWEWVWASAGLCAGVGTICRNLQDSGLARVAKDVNTYSSQL